MFKSASGRGTLYFVVGFSLVITQFALGEQRGVIDDPAGFVNLRAEKSADPPVIATIKAGEPFSFEPEEDNEWGKITLASGKSGWIRLDEIRLFFDENDLPEKDPTGSSEIDDAARARGFDYVTATRRAVRGDSKALKQFFALAEGADGAAAESITAVPTAVYHLLGDDKFAKFLAAQPVAFQVMVRNVLVRDGRFPPTILYLRRHFPETARVLFRREIVGWPSPNDRYAVRKVFSDAFDLSGAKVVRAELIEKKTGRVLCDLTADDIGTGTEREGTVLWSPDSKHVACLSIDLTAEQDNLFSTPRPRPLRKQTTVYQLSGESFARVDLSLSKVPGRESDKELEGAIPGHEYTEPVRWQRPNVLILQRHEYYRKIMPTVVDNLKFDSIHDLARLYQITATIDPDGKATVVWKARKDG